MSFSTVSSTPTPPRPSTMSHSNVSLATILDRFKANEQRILATTTASTSSTTSAAASGTATTAASATASFVLASTSPPSPPLSPSTRPGTSSQLSEAPRAAVLVGLFTHPHTNEVNVLLTLRASAMTSHQGEVALPGGRQDAEDGGDDVRTALREAEEEVGLDRSLAVPCARLRRVFSKKGLLVSPIVATIPVPSYLFPLSPTAPPLAAFTPHLSGSEVAAVFCLPLHTFLSSTEYRYEDRRYNEYTYRMHYFTRRTTQWIELDAEPPLSTVGGTSGGPSMVNWRLAAHEREFLVWGMTAAVLVSAARVAFDAAPEFAVPGLTANKGERPVSPAANVAVSEDGTVSQSNL